NHLIPHHRVDLQAHVERDEDAVRQRDQEDARRWQERDGDQFGGDQEVEPRQVQRIKPVLRRQQRASDSEVQHHQQQDTRHGHVPQAMEGNGEKATHRHESDAGAYRCGQRHFGEQARQDDQQAQQNQRRETLTAHPLTVGETRAGGNHWWRAEAIPPAQQRVCLWISGWRQIGPQLVRLVPRIQMHRAPFNDFTGDLQVETLHLTIDQSARMVTHWIDTSDRYSRPKLTLAWSSSAIAERCLMGGSSRTWWTPSSIRQTSFWASRTFRRAHPLHSSTGSPGPTSALSSPTGATSPGPLTSGLQVTPSNVRLGCDGDERTQEVVLANAGPADVEWQA